MQYDTIEELTLELALYPNKKMDILEDCAGICRYGWFAVAKDGNCALFDDNGEIDDLSKIKSISESMIPKDIEKIIIPDSVVKIWFFAFRDCIKLTNVLIPNSVTSIGNCAFDNCISLESITIPNSVSSIGDSTFYGCSRLTNVTISNSITNIGDFTFYHCSQLTSVMIPDSVMSIGYQAFSGCKDLMNMTIPDSVTSIGYGAFLNCNNLKSITFKGKTIEEVKSMTYYPFRIKDESIIRCEG